MAMEVEMEIGMEIEVVTVATGVRLGTMMISVRWERDRDGATNRELLLERRFVYVLVHVDVDADETGDGDGVWNE